MNEERTLAMNLQGLQTRWPGFWKKWISIIQKWISLPKEWISTDKMDIFAEAPCMNEEHEVFCSV